MFSFPRQSPPPSVIASLYARGRELLPHLLACTDSARLPRLVNLVSMNRHILDFISTSLILNRVKPLPHTYESLVLPFLCLYFCPISISWVSCTSI